MEEAAMAARASLQDLLEEATFSICLDYFQDPVLITECGHNFCRGYLTRSWGTSESEASCPQCRQTYAPPPPQKAAGMGAGNGQTTPRPLGRGMIPAEEAFQEYQVGISQEESLQGGSQILSLLSNP
uniref:RING-type domain-containing protein n=1 Tax=Laticauda laticaudata TaxID=8630 RepID=A0A8C5RIR9_LATLA